GSAVSTTISSGGSETVSSGGSALSTQIKSGGVETVSSGGVASAGTISGGGTETVALGGTTINPVISGSGAVLNLLGGAIVSGGIGFAGSGGQLQIAGSAMPSSTISGFIPGDTFDLKSIPFESAGSINLTAGNVLQITEGGTTYNLHLDPTQNFIGDFFHLVSDGGSGTLVTEDATPPPPPPPSLGQSPVVLNDFGWAQGWGGAVNPRLVADANGDGTSDYVGFGYSNTFIAYGGTVTSGASTGPGFTSVTAAVEDFGTSGGYTDS